MYEALLKNTPEYQKTAASLASPGPAALFGLPPAGRALLYAALQKDTGRILCVVTPGEAEATHFADDLKTLGLSAAVFPPRDFMLRPVEGAGREYEYRRLSVLGALAGGDVAGLVACGVIFALPGVVFGCAYGLYEALKGRDDADA